MKQTCILVLLLILSACSNKFEEGAGNPVSWDQLPGWHTDDHSKAWPALLKSCKALGKRKQWASICTSASAISNPDREVARKYFETHFTAYEVHNKSGSKDGLFTGYFVPLLHGSKSRTERYKYPLYARPKDLLIVDLSSLYPQLKGMRLRGRLIGNRVVPYYSRAEIESGKDLLKGHELFWVDDAVALFFLQIQGSGVVKLPDNSSVSIGYADQNGHPYTAIGRELISIGAIPREKVSLQSIRKWLTDNPDKMHQILNTNASYVFFSIRENGPLGSLGVQLTPERSIAVDRKFIPLGSPVWIDTTLPESTDHGVSKDNPYRRLVFAQDTGGAIGGAVRADVFWGAGDRAKYFAGHMKQPGRLYLLRPKPALEQAVAK